MRYIWGNKKGESQPQIKGMRMSCQEDASSQSQRSEPPVRKVSTSWPRLRQNMVGERRPMPPEWGKGARALEQESWKVGRVTYLFHVVDVALPPSVWGQS